MASGVQNWRFVYKYAVFNLQTSISPYKLAPRITTQHDVVFNEIQDTLIQGIRDARYLIWISVAWFSNEVFFNELLQKKQSGLNIRVIVSDEESNQNLFPKLEKEFDCIKIPHFGNWGRKNM